jgi:tryptophan synthase beta chain
MTEMAKPSANFEVDDLGHFGPFGGAYASETLMHALEELTTAYRRWSSDPEFMERLDRDLAQYVGRPSPIYPALRLTE